MRIDTRTWIDAIVQLDPVHGETMQRNPVRIDVSPLPFYRGRTQLVEAMIQLPHRLIHLCYAGSLHALRTLHDVRDLAALNAKERLRIGPGDLPAYLRLHVMVAGRARWRLIERVEDVPLSPLLDGEELGAWKRKLAAVIHPVVPSSNGDRIRASITLLDRSELSELDLWIEPDGTMNIRRCKRLLAGVPVRALRR